MKEIKKEILQDIKMSNDGDPWGNCMSWLFTIAGHLYELDPEGVPDSWQYRAGLGGGIDLSMWQDQHLAQYRTGYTQEIEDIFCNEETDDYDLEDLDETLGNFQPDALEAIREIGAILERYSRLLTLAGKDY